jgi:hypothetical protein
MMLERLERITDEMFVGGEIEHSDCYYEHFWQLCIPILAGK